LDKILALVIITDHQNKFTEFNFLKNNCQVLAFIKKGEEVKCWHHKRVCGSSFTAVYRTIRISAQGEPGSIISLPLILPVTLTDTGI
jgi:hypothetical protein